MFSPLTLIRTVEFLESVFICLFPIALVSSITLTGILIYLGAFTLTVLLILKQKQYFKEAKIVPWHVSTFFIYIFTFTLSRFINSGVESGFHAFFRTCQDYFVFLWVLLFVYENNKNQRLLKYFFLFSVLITICYGMLQYFHLDFLHRQAHINKLSGLHKNPYTYAGQLIIFFFLLLNKLLSDATTSARIFTALSLTACLFCILNSSERAVILGVFIGLVIFFVLKKVKKEFLLKLIPVIFIPIFFTMLFNKKLVQRIKYITLLIPGAKQNARVKLWNIAFSLWKRNILFGYGNFPTVYCIVGEARKLKALTHAHNVYLNILVTNGIIGLFGLLNIFFSVLKVLFSNLKKNQYEACLVAVIFVFFVEGLFEYFWGDSEVRYLLLYFMGFVVGHLPVSSVKQSIEN